MAKVKADAEPKMARVKNLSAWSGHDFNHGYGAIIDLPEDIAEARIAAGIAEEAPAGSDLRPAFNLDNAEDRYLELEREHSVLKEVHATVIAERDELKTQVEALTKPAS